ncbi:TPA: winged helix-turn-helix transcriptional regulator [Legionella pneumophila]|uniref:ArsR family transcriptional regulator n=2 Tax=Legionella TaxID=445 RepID=A0A378PLQ0_9GAMM|nr:MULTISPECIES: metalloregulator ArsR/SmtB family transcription factor [Legionella]MCA0402231.1 metalloregulator ArsR/SmtB family transcription factor [Pseudomonadota bacterium]HAT2055525.1 winged helix-turn-helix transcriptional regulator [Legionella pneumophila]KTD70664.1 ArsR family transcriptional regulator [Legionella steigerwaltii]MBN9228997.1 winged helix-turn-helix transcriptional regulator [Legionella steelei]MCL9684064.1 metalloregulator ArsR/SmtB family transcription factor [Legion
MLTQDQIITLSDILHLMGEPNRLKLLIACLDGPKSVSELAEQLQLSVPLASHHLSLLRSARLLLANREGKHIYYTIYDAHVRCILEDMLKHFTEEMEN